MSGFLAFGGARTTPRHDQMVPAPSSAWAPLRRGVFLALWIAALASNLGTWMQNVGAAWMMTSISKSALMVSLIQTASSLPIFFMALPAGALADIVDRRRLLIFSQAWMLVAAGALGILTLLGMTTEWVLLGLSFMLGIGSALNAPAWQAIIPELVPREELASAVTLNGINFNLARAVGPALGGLVVAWIGRASWRLAAADEVETDIIARPHPETAIDINPDSGPALITVEYHINREMTEEFVAAMRELRRIRLRDGAVFWGLFVDASQPDRFVENFVTETWVEHLRQHERMIASDLVYDTRAKSFQLDGAPAVTHLIAADAVAGRDPGSFRSGRVATAVITEAEPTLKKVQL